MNQSQTTDQSDTRYRSHSSMKMLISGNLFGFFRKPFANFGVKRYTLGEKIWLISDANSLADPTTRRVFSRKTDLVDGNVLGDVLCDVFENL